jgi:hypothetical protein
MVDESSLRASARADNDDFPFVRRIRKAASMIASLENVRLGGIIHSPCLKLITYVISFKHDVNSNWLDSPDRAKLLKRNRNNTVGQFRNFFCIFLVENRTHNKHQTEKTEYERKNQGILENII